MWGLPGGSRNAFTFVFSLLFYVCFFLSLRCFFAHLPGPVVIGSEKFQVFFKVLVRWGPIQASKQTKRTILQLTHTHKQHTHTRTRTHTHTQHAEIHCIGAHTHKKSNTKNVFFQPPPSLHHRPRPLWLSCKSQLLPTVASFLLPGSVVVVLGASR